MDYPEVLVNNADHWAGGGGFPRPPMDRRTPPPVRLRPQSFCDLVPADGMYCLSGWRLDSEIQESSGLFLRGPRGQSRPLPALSGSWGSAVGGSIAPSSASLCVSPGPLSLLMRTSVLITYDLIIT